MKLSSTEEYGLRCLLQVAKCGDGESMTISEISRTEGLSVPNAAKLMRLLRLGGMVESARGQSGGYTLARPANKIKLVEALEPLGGPFFSPMFCDTHPGTERACRHSADCSLRSLWSTLQLVLTEVLTQITLQDLMCNEQELSRRIAHLTSGLRNLIAASTLRKVGQA